MSEDWVCPPDRFPIMMGMPRPGQRQLTVPLALVQAHARQANINHGQTVARLKERGGLSWGELCAILEDRAWARMDIDLAHERAMRLVFAKEPTS